MKQRFYTALLTPFYGNGDLNLSIIGDLIEYNRKQQMDGLYVNGSTAEVFSLSAEERIAVFQEVALHAKDLDLIAHIGSLNLREAIEIGLKVKDMGYEIISSVTPFYFKYSFEEIIGFYQSLYKAIGLKIIIYIIPHLSGVEFTNQQLEQLISLDFVAGVKFTSNNQFQLFTLAHMLKEDQMLYAGFDEIMLASLALGAHGGIGTTYNFQGQKFVTLNQAVQSKDLEQARQIQFEINEIIHKLIQYGVLPASKVIMKEAGIDLGSCRSPISPLTDNAQKDIIKTYKKYFD